jgi:diguanylate cyclase (GGDEF)-like protein
MAEARVVAEKIRAGIEQTVVEIGPGRYARVTISLGTAGSDIHKVEPKGIVSLADAALYQAKEQGRNRVEAAPSSEAELSAAARRRAGKSDAHKPVELRAS